MGLSTLQACHMHKNAQIDLRAFTQLSVINFVGFLGVLGLYFFKGVDTLGFALWSLLFLILFVVCAIMAKKSHKAVRHWGKLYEEALARDK